MVRKKEQTLRPINPRYVRGLLELSTLRIDPLIKRLAIYNKNRVLASDMWRD